MTSNDFHYTTQEMVTECLLYVPIKKSESIVDAGSGKNKIWFNSIDVDEKYECEIDDGDDFFGFARSVDWVIGNPPFNLGWKFVDKAMSVANRGIAFLHNINSWNQYTPKRLNKMRDCGFNLRHIHITTDPRWYGRYYFVVWSKESGDINFTWRTK